AELADEVPADRIGAAVDRREVLEVAAARDPDRDLGALVDHLAAGRPLLENGVAILVALAIQRDDAGEPRILEEDLGLVQRAADHVGDAHHATVDELLGRHYLISSRTFSATCTWTRNGSSSSSRRRCSTPTLRL